LSGRVEHAHPVGQQASILAVCVSTGRTAAGSSAAKGIPTVDVPAVCILDPDGDIVRWLRKEGRSRPFEGWPCYHTQLDAFELAGQTAGIAGCVVGAPFAVLIAEELFESGCRLLLSVTSAGQIVPVGATPYFVIIDRALRDEGTSYHYAEPSEYGEANPELVAMAVKALETTGQRVIVGPTWTTESRLRIRQRDLFGRLASFAATV
jgi:hypothetical protein